MCKEKAPLIFQLWIETICVVSRGWVEGRVVEDKDGGAEARGEINPDLFCMDGGRVSKGGGDDAATIGNESEVKREGAELPLSV
jgi:hypothetical protein